MAPAVPPSSRAGVAVLAPSPILTVTIERQGEQPELHLHPGGQGFWVARMARLLGVEVDFCAPLGGEVGAVLGTLIEREQLNLRAVETAGCNGAYVHDRHESEAVEVANTPSPRLTRHEVDGLFSATVAASLEAGLAILTGPRDEHVFNPAFYGRLAADLRSNDCTVLADLSGPPLVSALASGVDLLHISERELREHAGAELAGTAEIIEAMEALRDEGARQVLLSRGSGFALALVDDRIHELDRPGLRCARAHGHGRLDVRGGGGVHGSRPADRAGAADGRCRGVAQRGTPRSRQRQPGGHRAGRPHRDPAPPRSDLTRT